MKSAGSTMGRIGVVLSTGDLRGVFAHAGFLAALEEMGIRYQAMAGSSAGAIVAAVVASGMRPRDFAEWLKGLKVADYWKRDSFWTLVYRMLIRKGRGYTGLVSTDPLEHTLAGLLKADTFEACPIPLYLTATNITTGSMEVFHSGGIAERAVASAAIPALMKAKRIGASYYVDGGVYELTPRSAICCREKLDLLIVNRIKGNPDPAGGDNQFIREPWTLLSLVGRVLAAIYEKEVPTEDKGLSACPCGCAARIVTLTPRLDPMDRLKPRQGLRVLQQGHEETTRLLPPLLNSLSPPFIRLGEKPPHRCG